MPCGANSALHVLTGIWTFPQEQPPPCRKCKKGNVGVGEYSGLVLVCSDAHNVQ